MKSIEWGQVLIAFVAGVLLHAVVWSMVNAIRGHAQSALGS